MPFVFTQLWLTPICLPATVTVVLRALEALLPTLTVTVALPEPLVLPSTVHVAPLVPVQLQPVVAVTVMDFEPPEALNERDDVETL